MSKLKPAAIKSAGYGKILEEHRNVLEKGDESVRILHTSDWHLGKTLENINRMDEQRQFVDELCSVAEREKVDVVLVAGDIYDTYNPPAAAEELFYDAVDRLNDRGRRAVIVIAGNHDNPERLCASSPLAYRNGIILLGYPGSNSGVHTTGSGGVKVTASGAGWLRLNVSGCGHDAVVITLPYPSETRLEQVLCSESDEIRLQLAYSDKVGSILKSRSQEFKEDTVNLVIGHIFLRGGRESESERTLQVGGAMTVDPGVLPGNAHFVALGHLHRPQRIKEAPCPAYYSGSPLAYSFSEADYCKVLYLIDAIPGGRPVISEIPLNCGKPLKRWVAKNGIAQALGWCEEGRDRNAWIDLEVYTDRILSVDEQKLLRELNPGIINIRPVIKSEISEAANWENRETKKVDELFKDYYRFRTGIEVSQELMETFIDVLNENEEVEDTGSTVRSMV